MLYLVGGCSRSGKSMLAERIRVRHNIPWFTLDALMMGLHRGVPSYGVHPDQDDMDTADRMWPVTEAMLEHFLFDGRDYLIEGVNLRPHTVLRFMQTHDEPMRVCFLGYPDADIETKAGQVAAHAGPPTDWLHRTGPRSVRRYLNTSKMLSRRLRDDCARCGLAFFDTGTNFDAGIAAAEQALLGGEGGVQCIGCGTCRC